MACNCKGKKTIPNSPVTVKVSEVKESNDKLVEKIVNKLKEDKK